MRALHVLIIGLILAVSGCIPAPAASPIRPQYTVDTVAELEGLHPSSISAAGKTVVRVLGYYSRGDWGAGRDVSLETNSAAERHPAHVFTNLLPTTRWRSGDGTSAVQNLRWYGAKGDGLTDDTAAIQAALNWYPTNRANTDTNRYGGRIYAPAGVYRTRPLLLTNNSITLIGDGVGATRIVRSGSGETLKVTAPITSTASTPYQQFFRIEDIAFDSEETDNTNESASIVLEKARWFVIENCLFQGYDKYKVRLTNTLDGLVSNVRMDARGPGQAEGLFGLHYSPGNLSGPNVHGVEYSKFFNLGRACIYLGGDANFSTYQSHIRNCTFENGAGGVLDVYKGLGVTLYDCYMEGFGSDGDPSRAFIRLLGTDGSDRDVSFVAELCTFGGPRLATSTNFALIKATEGNSITFRNNRIFSFGLDTGGTNYIAPRIDLGPNVLNVTFENNVAHTIPPVNVGGAKIRGFGNTMGRGLGYWTNFVFANQLGLSRAVTNVSGTLDVSGGTEMIYLDLDTPATLTQFTAGGEGQDLTLVVVREPVTLVHEGTSADGLKLLGGRDRTLPRNSVSRFKRTESDLGHRWFQVAENFPSEGYMALGGGETEITVTNSVRFIYLTNSVPTLITNFTDAFPYQRVVVFSLGTNNTLVHQPGAGGISLANQINWTMPSGGVWVGERLGDTGPGGRMTETGRYPVGGAGSGLDAEALEGVGRNYFVSTNDASQTKEGALSLGYEIVSGSSAKLQVGGSARMGTLFLHDGGAEPNTNRVLDSLYNSGGVLKWAPDAVPHTIWTAGNDGSGSGLDSDRIDSYDTPATGDAATNEVVLGSDTRLTDARTPTSHTHPSTEISDSTAAGRTLLTAVDAAAQRTALELGTAALRDVPATGDAATNQAVLGSDTRLTDARTPTSHGHLATEITNSTAAGRTLLTAVDAAAQRTALELGTAALRDVPATGDAATNQAVLGSDTRLTDARTPSAHTHPSTEISDSSSAGRTLLTAVDAAAQRTALGLGSLALVNDAPSDTNIYGRRSNGWVAIPSTSGGSSVSVDGVEVADPDFITDFEATGSDVRLSDTGVSAGTITNPVVTVDAKGRITAMSAGPSYGVTTISNVMQRTGWAEFEVVFDGNDIGGDWTNSIQGVTVGGILTAVYTPSGLTNSAQGTLPFPDVAGTWMARVNVAASGGIAADSIIVFTDRVLQTTNVVKTASTNSAWGTTSLSVIQPEIVSTNLPLLVSSISGSGETQLGVGNAGIHYWTNKFRIDVFAVSDVEVLAVTDLVSQSGAGLAPSAAGKTNTVLGTDSTGAVVWTPGPFLGGGQTLVSNTAASTDVFTLALPVLTEDYDAVEVMLHGKYFNDAGSAVGTATELYVNGVLVVASSAASTILNSSQPRAVQMRVILTRTSSATADLSISASYSGLGSPASGYGGTDTTGLAATRVGGAESIAIDWAATTNILSQKMALGSASTNRYIKLNWTAKR